MVAAATIYPIYYLGKELYDDLTGILASAIWAISIPIISFSTTAKEDTLLTFFWILTIYFFILAKKDSKYYKHLAISLGLAAASKYVTPLLVVVILVLYYLAGRDGEKMPTLKEILKTVVPISFFVVEW